MKTKTFDWRSTAMWTAPALFFLFLALTAGPTPALAGNPHQGASPAGNLPQGVSPGTGAVLNEVIEDMYLCADEGCTQFTSDVTQAVRRQAVAQLSGVALLGTPLCPSAVLVWAPGATACLINATGWDNLSLADGRGAMGGTFTVTVQDSNNVDSPEFVALTGSFGGTVDLSLALAGIAPIGYVTGGQGVVEQTGQTFAFTGTFRLPFDPAKGGPSYLADDFVTLIKITGSERSLTWPTVRLEISF